MNQDLRRMAEEVELPKPALWHDPKTGHWKKLTKPDRPTYEAYYTTDQVREAIAAALVKLPTGNDPEMGFILESATENELAAYDHAVQCHCQAVLEILDGKDDGRGTNNEPWATVRKRLLELVELTQGQEPVEYQLLVLGSRWAHCSKHVYEKSQDRSVVRALYTHPIPSQQEERVRGFDSAFAKGWRASAVFGNRTDLIADIGSPAYASIRDAARNKEQGK